MKIKHTLQLLFPATMLLFASCLENIDLDHLRPEPKLVLNAVALVNSPLTASLSRTWFYTDNHSNVTIRDARVELYVNDTFRELLVWKEGDADYNSDSYYTSAYCPAVGDRIRLVAKAEGFKDASAETVLPQPSLLMNGSITIKSDTAYFDSYYEIAFSKTYRVTMKDDGEQENYYLIRLEDGFPTLEEDNTWSYRWYSKTGYVYKQTKPLRYSRRSLFFVCVPSSRRYRQKNFILLLFSINTLLHFAYRRLLGLCWMGGSQTALSYIHPSVDY